MKLTTGRPATGMILCAMAILSQVEWMVYFLWVGATPALVLLARLMLETEA